MSQPIVPLTVPKLRRFEKKSRNEILMKIRLEKVELTFFHCTFVNDVRPQKIKKQS